MWDQLLPGEPEPAFVAESARTEGAHPFVVAAVRRGWLMLEGMTLPNGGVAGLVASQLTRFGVPCERVELLRSSQQWGLGVHIIGEEQLTAVVTEPPEEEGRLTRAGLSAIGFVLDVELQGEHADVFEMELSDGTWGVMMVPIEVVENVLVGPRLVELGLCEAAEIMHEHVDDAGAPADAPMRDGTWKAQRGPREIDAPEVVRSATAADAEQTPAAPQAAPAFDPTTARGFDLVDLCLRSGVETVAVPAAYEPWTSDLELLQGPPFLRWAALHGYAFPAIEDYEPWQLQWTAPLQVALRAAGVPYQSARCYEAATHAEVARGVEVKGSSWQVRILHRTSDISMDLDEENLAIIGEVVRRACAAAGTEADVVLAGCGHHDALLWIVSPELRRLLHEQLKEVGSNPGLDPLDAPRLELDDDPAAWEALVRDAEHVTELAG